MLKGVCIHLLAPGNVCTNKFALVMFSKNTFKLPRVCVQQAWLVAEAESALLSAGKYLLRLGKATAVVSSYLPQVCSQGVFFGSHRCLPGSKVSIPPVAGIFQSVHLLCKPASLILHLQQGLESTGDAGSLHCDSEGI